MSQAKQGDTVHVHYTGRLADGTVFDSSEGRSPLEFVMGMKRVIPGFEKAIEGLGVGERTTIQIPPAEAYGERSEELMLSVPRDQFPDNITPEVGQELEMTTPDGQRAGVLVTGVDDEAVQLDANHPLAGRELHFDLELVQIG